jgi:carboxyl-terminal processing protease
MNLSSKRILLIGLAAIILLGGAFSGGVFVGWFLPRQAGVVETPVALNPISPTLAPGSPTLPTAEIIPTAVSKDQLFKPFWQAWDIVHEEYVDQPVDDTALMRGAINGMIAALGDKHSSYMDPDQYKMANSSLEGEYEGIGAWVDLTGDYLTIISPIPNTPAEKAGLRAGDKIIAIDGVDMTGIDSSIVHKKVLGPAGSEVTLTIQRLEVDTPFDVTITRAKVVVPSVTSKMLDGQIAYVQIIQFGEKTTSELSTQLKDLMKQNPKGLILDLRNNGGGYRDTAIQVLSEFLPNNQIAMLEQFGDGTTQEFKTSGRGLAVDIPMVVLVNEGSASASEITAGALQDYQRAQLVGVTTYGKGSVQVWLPLDDNQGAVRVTVARWLTPKSRQINEVGLDPDVEVKISDEQYAAGEDPQLARAVELLSQVK